MIKVEKIAHWTGHQGAVFALEGKKEASKIISGGGDGWVVEWDLSKPNLAGKLIAKVETSIYAVLKMPEQPRLVVGNRNGGVHWIDLENSLLTKNISFQKKAIFGIQLFDNQLFTIDGSGYLSRWEIAKSRAIESIQLSHSALRSLAFAPLKEEMAIGASDGNIYILNAKNFELKKIIAPAHDNSVFTLQYSADETKLLSGGRDAHIKAWNVTKNYELISTQPAHWFTVNSLVFHPSQPFFATASRDKTIKIWDAASCQLLKVIDTSRNGCHARSVNILYWSGYKNLLVSGSDDATLMVWEIDF